MTTEGFEPSPFRTAKFRSPEHSALDRSAILSLYLFSMICVCLFVDMVEVRVGPLRGDGVNGSGVWITTFGYESVGCAGGLLGYVVLGMLFVKYTYSLGGN